MESIEDKEDSKPAASTAIDIDVNYDDNFFKIDENSGLLLQMEEEKYK